MFPNHDPKFKDSNACTYVCICVGKGLEIRGPLHLPNDIITLGEEREPIVQHLLLVVWQVRPFGLDIIFFRGCLGECAGGVFANEDWCVLGRLGKGVCAPAIKRRAGKACTRVGAAWLIGFVSCYIEYYPLDCYVGFSAIFTYKSVSNSIRAKQSNGLKEGGSRNC